MSKELLATIEQVSRVRGLDPGFLIQAIEEAVTLAAYRTLNRPIDLRAELDRSEGTMRLYARKTVVAEVHDPFTQIDLERAQEIDPEITIGNRIDIDISELIRDRLKTVQIAKKAILNRVKDAEKLKIHRTYQDQIGRVLTGTVKTIWRGDVILDLPDCEALLPREFQLPRDRFQRGQYIRALLVRTTPEEDPPLVVSRVHPDFICRLMEMEIEEVFNGTVEIVRILREPGERAKVAVRSLDPNVDPVGACVGVKGARIIAVMNELHGERIDVIQMDEDICQFAANALKPARVVEVHILDENEKILEAIVEEDQSSIAIGKGGINVKLASRLVGWRIEIIRASEKAGHFAPTTAAVGFYDYARSQGMRDDVVDPLLAAGYDRIVPLIRASIHDLEAVGLSHEQARRVKSLLREYTRGAARAGRATAVGKGSAPTGEEN